MDSKAWKLNSAGESLSGASCSIVLDCLNNGFPTGVSSLSVLDILVHPTLFRGKSYLYDWVFVFVAGVEVINKARHLISLWTLSIHTVE